MGDETPQAARSTWITIGAVSGLLGVALGAFGAHGLEKVAVGEEALDWWETAVHYHLVHALALVLWQTPAWPSTPWRETARAVDAYYGLDDQLGNALELRDTPPRQDDPRTAQIVELMQQLFDFDRISDLIRGDFPLAFDAMQRAREEGTDILIVDTAGRLQNKKDLMAELEKIAEMGRILSEVILYDPGSFNSKTRESEPVEEG